MQHRPDCGECEQCNRVKHKNSSERDGNLFLARIGDWGNRGDGAAAADGRAGRNEVRDSLFHLQESSQPPTQEQGDADATCGIDETGVARLHNLLQIHTKPKADHGGLEEKFG